MPQAPKRNPLAQDQRPLLDSFEIRLMIADLVQRQQLSPQQLLADTGVSTRLLDTPGLRLTLPQELLLYTRIAQFNDDPTLGIRIGSQLGVADYGILGYALMGAETVLDALQLLTEFAPLVSWASHSQLTQENYAGVPCSVLAVFPTAADAAAQALEVECTFASLQRVFEDLLGEPMPLQAVEVVHDNPAADHPDYARIFHAPVHFGGSRNALLIPRALLKRRLRHPLPEYRELLRDLCRENMSEVTEERGLVGSIRSVLRGWPGASPGIEQVAAHFNQSSRTLRRHLRASGVSYQSLLDEFRYEEARRLLLSSSHTMDAIAGQLGYADARSFRTAFKRWSGQLPTQFRHTQHLRQ